MRVEKTHINALLERRIPEDTGEIQAAVADWEAILGEWEKDFDDDADVASKGDIEAVPLPSLLDFWTPPEESNEPSGQVSPVPEVIVEPEPASKLAQKVQE